MAIPTFVAAGTPAAGVGSVVPGLPAGLQEDDLMFLAIEGEGEDGNADPQPAGWGTLLGTVASGTSGQNDKTRLTIYYRWATATESAPTVPDAGNHTFAVISAWRGVDPTTPIHQSQSGSYSTNSGSPRALPVVTTTIDDCLILHFVTAGDNTLVSFANPALADPTITKAYEPNTSSGSDGTNACAYGGLATAGSSGTSATHDWSTLEESAMFTVALAPDAAAPTYVDGEIALVGVGDLASTGEVVVEGAAALTGVGDLVATGLVQITIEQPAPMVIRSYMYRTAVRNINIYGPTGVVRARAWPGTLPSDIEGAAALTGVGVQTADGEVVVSGDVAVVGVGAQTSDGEVAVSGAAALAGVGVQTADGNADIEGAATHEGEGALTATGQVVVEGSALHEGEGVGTQTGQVVVEGAITLTGVGVQTADGATDTNGSITLIGVGVQTASGDASIEGAATLTGVGVVTADGDAAIEGAAVLTGVGAQTADGDISIAGDATLTGVGSQTSSGEVVVDGAAVTTGVGDQAATGGVVVDGSVTLTGVGAQSATGEVNVGVQQASTAIIRSRVFGTTIRNIKIYAPTLIVRSRAFPGTTSAGPTGVTQAYVSVVRVWAWMRAATRDATIGGELGVVRVRAWPGTTSRVLTDTGTGTFEFTSDATGSLQTADTGIGLVEVTSASTDQHTAHDTGVALVEFTSDATDSVSQTLIDHGVGLVEFTSDATDTVTQFDTGIGRVDFTATSSDGQTTVSGFFSDRFWTLFGIDGLNYYYDKGTGRVDFSSDSTDTLYATTRIPVDPPSIFPLGDLPYISPVRDPATATNTTSKPSTVTPTRRPSTID